MVFLEKDTAPYGYTRPILMLFCAVSNKKNSSKLKYVDNQVYI